MYRLKRTYSAIQEVSVHVSEKLWAEFCRVSKAYHFYGPDQQAYPKSQNISASFGNGSLSSCRVQLSTWPSLHAKVVEELKCCYGVSDMEPLHGMNHPAILLAHGTDAAIAPAPRGNQHKSARRKWSKSA